MEKKRGGRVFNQRNSNELSEPENGEKGEGRAAVFRCKSAKVAIFFDTFTPFLSHPTSVKRNILEAPYISFLCTYERTVTRRGIFLDTQMVQKQVQRGFIC